MAKKGISGKKLRILLLKYPRGSKAEAEAKGGNNESNGNRKEDRRTRQGRHSQGDPPYAAHQGRRPVIDNLARDIRQKGRKSAKLRKTAPEYGTYRIFAGEGERGGGTRGTCRKFFRGGSVYARPSFACGQRVHKEREIICGNRAEA